MQKTAIFTEQLLTDIHCVLRHRHKSIAAQFFSLDAFVSLLLGHPGFKILFIQIQLSSLDF